jgi:hypothetical protein
LLSLVPPVGDAALLEGEHRLRKGVALLALVRACLAALPELAGFRSPFALSM